MDVGAPSNFARVLDLYDNSHEAITAEISGVSYTDEEIANTLRTCKKETGYLLDPHGACGYQALKDNLQPKRNRYFLETAHPAKFMETVESILNERIMKSLKSCKVYERHKRKVSQ